MPYPLPSEVLTNREKLIKTILTLLHSCLVLSTRRKGAISLLFLFLCFLEAALFVERGLRRDEMRRKLASEQKTEVVTSLAPAFLLDTILNNFKEGWCFESQEPFLCPHWYLLQYLEMLYLRRKHAMFVNELMNPPGFGICPLIININKNVIQCQKHQ